MNEKRLAYLSMHTAILLFGFTPIFGRYLSNQGYSGYSMVLWRLAFTLAILYFFPNIFNKIRALGKDMLLKIAGVGLIVALHWIFFYASIAASNASIGVLCIATLSFFTALIEPFYYKKAISRTDLLLGAMIIPGMLLIVGSVDTQYYWGILLGIVAAILSAIFSIYNKNFVSKVDANTIMTVELTSGLLMMLAFAPFYGLLIGDIGKMFPTGTDWYVYLLFSVLATVVPFILSVSSLRHITAFASNLAFSLEPIYGIILAMFFFNEHKELGWGFYSGVVIILSAVFAHPFLAKKIGKAKAK